MTQINNPNKTSDDTLVSIFQTPLLRRRYKESDLNQNLKVLLLDLEKKHPELNNKTLQKSNYSGWRSDDYLLTNKAPCIKQLHEMVIDSTKMMLANAPKPITHDFGVEMMAWANINRTGSFNTPHMHAGFEFAAVYYVSVGTADPSFERNGSLMLMDPRVGAYGTPTHGFDFGHTTFITPEEGMLIIFPAWLMHGVMPFHGEGERISIPFNIRIINDTSKQK